MATLGSKVVLFGGLPPTGTTPLDDTWTFDGTEWVDVSPTTSPPASAGTTMATLGSKIVLFVAAGPTPPGVETWTFDGSTWTQVTTATAPESSIEENLATLGNEVVLYDTLARDTWTFDGSSWTQVSVPGPIGAFSVLPSLGGLPAELVLFADNDPNGFTYTFNGTAWSQPSGVNATNSPAGRIYASTASLGSLMVLFGGSNQNNELNDTWTFDGTSWMQVTTSTAPSPRAYASMALLP
jgi:hypothetical protein